MPKLSRVEELRILRIFLQTGSYAETARRCNCHRSTVSSLVARSERELKMLDREAQREIAASHRAFTKMQYSTFTKLAKKLHAVADLPIQIEPEGELRTDKNGKEIRLIKIKVVREILATYRELRQWQRDLTDLDDEPLPTRLDVRVTTADRVREQAQAFMKRHAAFFRNATDDQVIAAILPAAIARGLVDETGMPTNKPLGLDDVDEQEEEE